MRSGALDRRITIEQATATTDATGAEVLTWTKLADAWAERTPISATSKFAADQRYSDADTTYEIRWQPYVPTLSTKMNRIVYRDRIYNIMGVMEHGRQDSAVIVTKSRADLEGTP